MVYVVAQPGGRKRPALFKIVKQSGSRILGVEPNHLMYGEQLRAEFTSKDVMVTLGPEPAYGQVYGVTVEPVIKRYLIKGWGEVYHYVKLTDAEVDRLHRALQMSLAKLRQRGLDGWHPVLTEVRNRKGKENGCYKYNPKDQDVLVLRPIQGQGLRELVKLVVHEGAHGAWFRVLTPEQRAKWIEMYDAYVSVSTVTPGDVKRMVASIKQVDGIRPYMKDAEPEEQAAANIYLGWLRKVYCLSVRDVHDLISAGRKLPIPDTHLHKSAVATPITLYSKTSAAELYAEALSSDVVGDLADARIKALLRKG